MSEEQIIQDTTDLLLDCVSNILALVDVTDRMPQSGILIYESIGLDGTPRFDYVVTNTLSLTNIIGAADAVREQALRDLLDDEDDD